MIMLTITTKKIIKIKTTITIIEIRKYNNKDKRYVLKINCKRYNHRNHKKKNKRHNSNSTISVCVNLVSLKKGKSAISSFNATSASHKYILRKYKNVQFAIQLFA